MKTPSQELFYLIKSLNSQEKRFFKIYASRKEPNSNYTVLFDAIDEQENYDEQKLKQQLKKHAFVKDLHVVKNYTFETILRAMEQYHIDSSTDVTLQRYLQNIEFLVNKRLFDSVKKIINKAEKLAIENHQYLYLLNILAWKRKTTIKELNLKELKRYERALDVKEWRYVELYKNNLEYQKLYTALTILTHTRLIDANKEDIAELHIMLESPLLKDEAKAISPPGKFMFHFILGDVFLVLKNYKESYVHFTKAVAYFEPARIEPGEKLRIYGRLLIPPFRELQNNDAFLGIKNQAADTVRLLPPKSQTNDLYSIYLAIMNNYIGYAAAVFNMREVLASLDDIQALIEKHASTTMFIIYYSNRFWAYFVTPDFHHALYCCNKVLSVEKTGVRGDIVSFMKIFNIMVHYELGNEGTVISLCQSYSRHFEKQKRQNKVENILLNFFGKTIHANPGKKRTTSDKQNKIKTFIALKKELEVYKTESILEQFDFISWCDSKIQNRPMIEILKEKISLIPNPSPREKGA